MLSTEEFFLSEFKFAPNLYQSNFAFKLKTNSLWCQVEASNSCQYLKRLQLSNLGNVYNERLSL